MGVTSAPREAVRRIVGAVEEAIDPMIAGVEEVVVDPMIADAGGEVADPKIVGAAEVPRTVGAA